MAGDLKFSIKVEDNSKLVLEAEKKAIENALYAMGIKAVEGSVDAITGKYSIKPAVKTGRLRASISFITPAGDMSAVPDGMTRCENDPVENSEGDDKLSGTAEKNSVVVGSNVEYAEYVHNGTSRMEGRPFLRVGIEQTKGEMEKQVETILKGGTI